MNILHVVNISFVIPYFLGKQLLFFKSRNYHEHIICSFSDELKFLSKQYGFDYKSVDILRKFSVWKDIKAVIITMRYIKANHIDIVTGHTPKGALIAMVGAFFMRVPIRIYFRHGLVYETSTGIKRFFLICIDRFVARLSTIVVCVSPSVCRRSLEDKLNSSHKQCLLSKGTCNGIDIKRFSFESLDSNRVLELRNKLNLIENNFVIGFTGRLVKDKGIIELVRAFRLLCDKYKNLSLLLVGMLEERDALPKDVVDFIRENPSIVSTGYVPNSSIEYYYALMDVFVLPSYREGFPTSVLEASAMCLPIITTRATGCIDSILEEQTGTFVDYNPSSIASAIERFYLDDSLRCFLGRNGRAFVKDNFDQHVIWDEIESIYKQVKNKHREL